MERTTESEELLDEAIEEKKDDHLDAVPDEGPDEKPEEAPVGKPAEDSEGKPDESPEEKPVRDQTEEKDDSDEDEDFDGDSDEEEDPDEEPEDPDTENDEDLDEDSDESDEGGTGLNLFTFLVMLIAIAVTVVYFTCTVRTVHVSGNSLYTSDEIAEYVISDDSQLMHNTVFLAALYMTPWAPKIPFEEKVRVGIESYDTIRITVKDMDIAGFIPYAGKNLYFSPEGIVLENSPLTVRSATFVTGLSVSEAEIGKKMAAEDETGLNLILEALQIIDKYEMKAECLVLNRSGSVTMYMDRIKVQLGRSDFELKLSKIAQLMPYLEGRSGTIDLTNYSSADENIILK